MNFVVFLALVLIGVILQTTLFQRFPFNYFQPDFLLILITYMGFKRNPIEGGIFVCIASKILEAHSGAGQHFLLTSYIYCFIIAQILGHILVRPQLLTSIPIVAGLTLFKRTLILVLIGLKADWTNSLVSFFIHLLPSLLVQGLLAPFLFELFKSIDLATYKDEHAEDEYKLDRDF